MRRSEAVNTRTVTQNGIVESRSVSKLGQRNSFGMEVLLLFKLVLDDTQHTGMGLDRVAFAHKLGKDLSVNVLDLNSEEITDRG